MEDLLRTPLYHTLRTNQMGYIKVKAQLPGIYGNVNPWRLGFNYYILSYKAEVYGSHVQWIKNLQVYLIL